MVRPATSDDVLKGFYAGRAVCVTGGGGFIGSHLVDALVELRARVVSLDDLSNSDGSSLVKAVEGAPDRARFVFGSVLDPRALGDAVRGAQNVFHLAAMTSVPRSFEQPERVFEVNAMGTVRVAEASRRAGVGRLVYAASSSAYGDEPGMPRVETMLPRPMSPYAASKLAGESVVASWSRAYGLSGVSLRLFNVFGPRQAAGDAYAAVVAAFTDRLLAGQPPIIYGDGSATRDFTPVASVVRAMLLAGAMEEDPRGAVFNIGFGRRTSIADLARLLGRLTERPGVSPTFRAPRAGDVPHSLADISRASAMLGYTPSGTLEEALAETVAWYMERAERRGASGAPV